MTTESMRRVLIFDETRLTEIEDEPMGGTNRSGDLNEVMTCEQQRMLAQAVLDANREEARTDYQQEFATWERILADGLESFRCSVPVIPTIQRDKDAQEHEKHGHES